MIETPRHPRRPRTRGFAAAETTPAGLTARCHALVEGWAGLAGPERERALRRAIRRIGASSGTGGYDLVRHVALV